MTYVKNELALLSQIVGRHARGTMLRCLESAGGCLNDSMMRDFLDCLGLRLSAADFQSHLDWLAQEQLVRLETVTLDQSAVVVINLTQRGEEVSQRRTRRDEIYIPIPG